VSSILAGSAKIFLWFFVETLSPVSKKSQKNLIKSGAGGR
jgi:hypothetical protein